MRGVCTRYTRYTNRRLYLYYIVNRVSGGHRVGGMKHRRRLRNDRRGEISSPFPFSCLPSLLPIPSLSSPPVPTPFPTFSRTMMERSPASFASADRRSLVFDVPEPYAWKVKRASNVCKALIPLSYSYSLPLSLRLEWYSVS